MYLYKSLKPTILQEEEMNIIRFGIFIGFEGEDRTFNLFIRGDHLKTWVALLINATLGGRVDLRM